jgi:hypothetical protein
MSHPWLNNAICVLFVERNILAGPYVLEQIMEKRGGNRHYIIRDSIRNVIGWWTSRNMKIEYISAGSKLMRAGTICFMKDMICENPWQAAESRASLVKGKLLDQVGRFRMKREGDASRRVTPLLSGKIDENGKMVKGLNDDLAMAFFMGLYFIEGISKEMIPTLDYEFIKQERK